MNGHISLLFSVWPLLPLSLFSSLRSQFPERKKKSLSEDTYVSHTSRYTSAKNSVTPNLDLNTECHVDLSAHPILSLEAGVWSLQGRRDHQEDTFVLSDPSSPYLMYGVFDGHGGSLASYICATNMKRNFVMNFQSNGDVRGSLIRSFSQTESDYKNTPDPFVPNLHQIETSETPFAPPISRLRSQGREGCTAIVAYLDRNLDHVTVANAGDSRCILCADNGDAFPLSVDHKPYLEEEMKRIHYYGFSIIRNRIVRLNSEGKRVGGGLNLSRAIGDFYYGGAVPAFPDILIHQFTEDDRLLVLASDGLWDVLSNESVCKTAIAKLKEHHHDGQSSKDEGQRCNVATQIAEHLVTSAYAADSKDNITALVVVLPTLPRGI